jgi:two-component system sensor histidine kinase RegB
MAGAGGSRTKPSGDASGAASRDSSAARRPDPSGEVRPWYLEATPLDTLPWLIRIRWVSAAVQGTMLAVAWSLPSLDFPLRRLSILIAAATINSIACAVWLARGRALPGAAAAAGLGVDVLLLAGLLELTGGPFNPFSAIFAVHVTLAALTLGPWYAAAVAVLAAGSFGVLAYWHTQELAAGHHRLNDLPTHLFTLWVSVAATAELAAYFVVQASNALARREQELEAARRQAARTERLVSLTTLTAGAAHELSTPLATIALASRELERAATARGTVPDLAEDARLIRTEVDRCQAILDQMSGRAGGSAADDPELLDLAEIIDDLRTRLPEEQAKQLDVRMPGALPLVRLPREGLKRALQALVKNAFDASLSGDEERPEQPLPVAIDVAADRDTVRITVRDRGRGIEPAVLRRAGEPFFTTKEPGRGLGLGLFLTRVFAERFGGALTLQSADGRGTTARLELPLGAWSERDTTPGPAEAV